MKAVGDKALSLPWICPCASSLVSLAKDGPAAWQRVRTDPGAVLLVMRATGSAAGVAVPFPSLFDHPNILKLAHSLLQPPSVWVDWSAADAAMPYRGAIYQAALAQRLARETPGCDADRAWVGGLLASLGQFAAYVLHGDSLDHGEAASLGRRLSRLWDLPDWLSAVIGHLGLHVSVAQRLGAEPRLFQVVQLAVDLTTRHPFARGTRMQEAPQLHGSAEQLERIQAEAREEADGLLGLRRHWQNPAQQPLLADLLALAAQTRRGADDGLIERLQRDVDQLQLALEEQQERERERLQALKLSALAELAAGAGHEINNPLAVISGQAQYALKQLQKAESELVEDSAALAVLRGLRGGVERSLQAIVGQAQRIHHVLTDLIQFARPGAPRRQTTRLADVLRDVTHSCQALAEQRKVRLVCVEPPENWHIHVDPGQLRTALAGLLRNAIEAAPPEGWAGLRAEARTGCVGIVVEDTGQGPTPLALEHMFDPFFSGRSAGRGRGLGLPTAWRLARQQGGDVRFEGIEQERTRFVLTLPDWEVIDKAPVNGNGHYQEALNGSH